VDNITEGLINSIIWILIILIIFVVLFSALELHMIKKNTDQTMQDVIAVRKYIDSWEEVENSIDHRKNSDY
jgi:uncharacterized membrane protein